MDGRSTSSHDSEKFRKRSMEKQGEMVFGLWETATAVINRMNKYKFLFEKYPISTWAR
jgi:hypothetical protein